MITTTAIRLLLIDSIVVSLVLTEAIMRLDLLPGEIRGFYWAVIIAFQVVVVFFWIAALLDELRKFNASVDEIASLLKSTPKDDQP